MEHLDRARENLSKAMERAPSPIHLQLETIEKGIFEEEADGTTQGSTGPKIDRIAEVTEKLEGLEEELEDEDADETRKFLVDARHHLREYMRNHPQGG